MQMSKDKLKSAIHLLLAHGQKELLTEHINIEIVTSC